MNDEIRVFFDAANFATVSTINPDGAPQSSVIWVKTDRDDILFSTVKGRRKHRNLERDPRVSIVVFDPADPYRYVEVRGVVDMIDDPAGELIEELSWKYDDKAFQEGNPDNQRVIVRITPQKVVMHR
ncbi:PPOX class F420-dependent oxidoreductase [Streptosporangiaceae bacterium NEAU-GS5]|nr:PPOX class F420-dependent oxidoreductase [Streptosporangiaceae bacterium NEAU-GS5]